jgi:hypothetical protein
MFENGNLHGPDPLIEKVMASMEIANSERNKAFREMVAIWAQKIAKIRRRSIGLGANACG